MWAAIPVGFYLAARRKTKRAGSVVDSCLAALGWTGEAPVPTWFVLRHGIGAGLGRWGRRRR
jgi:hypothetical protein